MSCFAIWTLSLNSRMTVASKSLPMASHSEGVRSWRSTPPWSRPWTQPANHAATSGLLQVRPCALPGGQRSALILNYSAAAWLSLELSLAVGGVLKQSRSSGSLPWGYMPQASLGICSSCELPTIQQMGQTCYGMATSWRSWSWPASELFGLTVGGFRANHGVGKVWMDHTMNASSWGDHFAAFFVFV